LHVVASLTAHAIWDRMKPEDEKRSRDRLVEHRNKLKRMEEAIVRGVPRSQEPALGRRIVGQLNELQKHLVKAGIPPMLLNLDAEAERAIARLEGLLLAKGWPEDDVASAAREIWQVIRSGVGSAGTG
jgi:hypothetical protein